MRILASRKMLFRRDEAGQPASLDEKSRSVEVVASTDEPVLVFDWEKFEPVRESLSMSGLLMPEGGRVVLLDSHCRDTISDVIGSFRDIRVENGTNLVGRIFFSATPEGESAFRKVIEGHLTDVSVGYEVLAHTDYQAGAQVEIGGRIFEGPLRIAEKWRLFELSLCPIGADSRATVRKRLAGALCKRKIFRMEGKMSKKEKREILARLWAIRNKREAKVEPGDDVIITDENGEEIAVSDLTDEQLDEVIENLEETLAETQDEASAREEPASEKEEEKEKNEEKRGRIDFDRLRKNERDRIMGIGNLCRAHGITQEQEQAMIESGISLTRAKAQVLDLVSGRRAQGPGFHVSQGLDEAAKFRSAAADSLAMRVGLKLEKAAPGADELRGLTLRELAREFVGRAGNSVHGDIRQIVGRALTSTDLPALLVDVSRRVLMESFEAAPETWREWASTGVATDFKKTTAIGLEGDVKPRLTPEYGEMTEGRLAENAEEFQIATYTRKLVISRQAIINDDLNALQVIPRLYGEQTAEMVGDVAYEALLKAPAMGDGKPLFCADHNNLFTGKGAIPDVDNLGAVVTGMKLQKDVFGKPLSILPKIFLAPVGLEVACESFFNLNLTGSIVTGGLDNPLSYNPFGGSYFKRVYDRRLDEASASAWYLLAQRNTVCVYFLGGVESPYIETQTNFDSDAFESKVRMDVGAKALRWVTVAKATS